MRASPKIVALIIAVAALLTVPATAGAQTAVPLKQQMTLTGKSTSGKQLRATYRRSTASPAHAVAGWSVWARSPAGWATGA